MSGALPHGCKSLCQRLKELKLLRSACLSLAELSSVLFLLSFSKYV